MDLEDVLYSNLVYPILLMPKSCTTLDTDFDKSNDVYIEVKITTPDTAGNLTCIYAGLCKIKLFETEENQNCIKSPQNDISSLSMNNIDVDQLPIIFSETSPPAFSTYNQSEVWIDPCRSPFVYNRCESPSQEECFIRQSKGQITVNKHNTYITQNVYNYNEADILTNKEQQQLIDDSDQNIYESVPENITARCNSNMNCYEDDDFNCETYLSILAEETLNEEHNRTREDHSLIRPNVENNALKQLMSEDIQPISKQQKVILFSGNDSESGHTIQNISYSDPLVKCSGLEVDHEVVVDNISKSTKSSKKLYQCDKCKHTFPHLSEFHKHMINHNNPEGRAIGPANLMCSKCGKKFKSHEKFEMHCLGHGNPDLECPKCFKVYSSKGSLKVHLKIHDRKFPCGYCIRTYATAEELKTHIRKVHILKTCKYEQCLFVTNNSPDLVEHLKSHISTLNSHTDKESLQSHSNMEILKSHRNREPLQSHKNMEKLESPKMIETLKSHRDITNDIDFSNIYYEDVSDGDIQPNDSIGLDDDWKWQSNELAINGDEGSQVEKANSVIAKVMSNKMFLLNSKSAKKVFKGYKTCDVCYKSFTRISDLKRHLIEHVIRSTLTKSPVSKNGMLHILCEICNVETFTKVDKYKNHLREHANLTLYQCTFCDKSFSDSSNFSKHKKTHGLSFYHCDLCQRKFHSKKMIIQHMEYHNKNKPLNCRDCKKNFHFKSCLNKHMKSAHNKPAKYNCKFCDDVLKTLKDKWDHEWVVHNIRKSIMDCMECEAKFRKYSELKKHCIHDHGIIIRCERNKYKKRKRFY